MKIKTLNCLLSITLMFGFYISPLEIGYIAIAKEAPSPPEDIQDYYVETFVISGYYSPLPNQEKYATGSYESDIYLNGNGTNGADGTPVYPGMIACPRYRTLEDGSRAGYEFGTKFYIPGVGLTTCRDVGGAIVLAGERGYEYDRLDIWFGYGDEGLQRALNWGKRTVDVLVYGVRPDLEDEVYFDAFLAVEDLVYSTVLSPLYFKEDIYYGTESEEVSELVKYLIEWGYYKGEPTNFYGPEVAQAVFNFQSDFDIVSDPSEMGAGHFGIKTRTEFDKLLSNEEQALKSVQLKRGSILLSRYNDLFEDTSLFASALKLGDSGELVVKLQEELVRMGLLYKANGIFDEVTENAVFKFQQRQGLVTDKNDPAAGYVGPGTRSALNKIIESRYEAKSLMAYQRDQIENTLPQLALPNLYVILANEE